MVDRGHHIALAGQVFTQVAHQKAVARVAVRDDQQRVGAGAGIGLGVTHRAAGQGDFGFAIARQHLVLASRRLARRQLGGVPDLHRQRPVISGHGLAGLELDDVLLPRID